ncbi:MAG: LamG-like jellyroll fold domain-containing protein, partial [Akkermansiaceae bacterium]
AFTHTRGNGQQTGVDRDGAKLFGEQVNQNEEHHLVITVSPDGNLNTWIDGVQKLIDLDTNDLANVSTDFEAIGATSWGDPGMTGSINEFRIYEGELTSIEVAASVEAGPEELFVVSDSDGDGLPDTWEEKWFGENNLSQGANDDPDSDNLTNLEEFTFSLNLNPNKADTDEDNLNDGREINQEKTDPLLKDSDNDSLTDGDEILIHLTNPLSKDSDGDFYFDNVEIKNNSDPNDANDPSSATPTLAHRWSFNTGEELTDSVGGNTGVLRETASVSDNQLQLDGIGTGPTASSMGFTSPVDLGSNFSGSGFTIETWYTDSGTGIWGKLFTFGTSNVGQEIAWTNERGGNDNAPGLDRNGAKEISSIPFGTGDRLSLDEEHHLVVSVEPDGTTNLWIDGTKEISELPTNPVSNIVTDTESIGSTAWGDPGHFGSVNEFRIWEGTLTEDDVTVNLAAGPDFLPGEKEFAITSITRNPSNNSVIITFNSIVGRRYRIDRSPELLSADSPLWLDIDDEFIATSELSTFTDPTALGKRLFYRIKDITNQ